MVPLVVGTPGGASIASTTAPAVSSAATSSAGVMPVALTSRLYGWIVTDAGVVTTARNRGKPAICAARLRWLPSATTSSPPPASDSNASRREPAGTGQISWVRPAGSTSRTCGSPRPSTASASALCS